jgi:hypothetical protein
MSKLRNIGGGEYDPSPAKTTGQARGGVYRPQTISEMLDEQIKFHEAKIVTLKEAKAAISPDVERALNALAKL